MACPPVEIIHKLYARLYLEIIHELKLVDYLHVQAEKSWFKYYLFCIHFSATSTPLTVLGTGSASRQFMYSIDFAKLMIWAIREYEDAEPIIFARKL